jgi:hypothetical protein
MINKPMDLHGLLALIWKSEWARPSTESVDTTTIDEYKQANEDMQKTLTVENLYREAGKFA